MYTLLSPWPSQRNGIADYACEIVRHGASPVTVVTEAASPLPIFDKVRFETPDAFSRQPGPRRIYHFGNNPDHCFLVPLFMREPGIAVVHDVSLHYLAEKTDKLIPGFFREAVKRETGPHADALFRTWRGGLKRALDYVEIKCIDWLADAQAIVVHSHYARRMIEVALPSVAVHVIPHFAYVGGGYPTLGLRQNVRRMLKLERDAFVVSTLGFVTRHKQYDSVMRAIASLPESLRRKVTYVVAGQVQPHEYNIEADIREHGANYVRLLDYVSDQTMTNLMYASDLILNLRYPTFGESSGSVARALGVGAVLVVPDAGSFAEIPAEACFHVPPAADVSAPLARIIQSVMENPEQLEAKRRSAFHYAYQDLAPGACAARYEDIIYAT
jgi:glycosyltransferase involved in cell wall biosynthesis